MIKRGLPSWRLYQIFVPLPQIISSKPQYLPLPSNQLTQLQGLNIPRNIIVCYPDAVNQKNTETEI